MAKTARAAIEDLLTCESCHAFYYVERAEDGARTRLRCTSCGHSRDVLLSGAKTGKWTLIDPDGQVKTYGAWEDLLRATPGSGISAVRAKVPSDEPAPSLADDGERKSLSGSALLDITPTPPMPKLSLIDSSPALPAVTDEPPAAEAEAKPKPEPAPEAPPTEALSESAIEALVGSMPDATTAPPKTITKQEKPEAWDDDEAEVLSMRDVQVVREGRLSSTPPPPPAGQLRTLPPARMDAPPPPSITIEEPTPIAPAAKKDEKKEETAKAEETKPEPEKTEPKNKKKTKAADDDREEKDTSRTRPTTRPAAKSSASVATAKPAPEEDGGRGWVLPAIGVAAAAAVVWWIASGPAAPANAGTGTTAAQPPVTATAEPPAATATTTATAPEPVATATAAATATATTTEAPPADKAALPTAKEAPKATTTTTTEAPKKRAVDAVSLADALDKAGAAKRSGDYAAARELYGRVLREAPNNVEAHGGLGDIARAQGDLATAKASYQKALAASPEYGPAVLGLADTLWDMGDRAGAQTHYLAIVRVRGANAPERAKTRSTGN